MGTLLVRNLTRRKTPGFPFERARKATLPSFDISLAFIGTKRAQTLNRTLRGKSYVPNVLSYESGPKSGEILICLDQVQKEYTDYGLTPSAYAGYLFIHGLMHLKGHRHGASMEGRERAILARLGFVPSTNNETTHRHRHRHRHTPNKGGGR